MRPEIKQDIENNRPRRLELEGCYNLRDVGGYATADNRVTRWRTLWRADSLHRLSVADQETLMAEGIHTIIDLRRPLEVSAAPNVFANSTLTSYMHIPVHEDEEIVDQSEDLPELYRRILDTCQPQIRQILAQLAQPDAFPALVHCSAGKDRTGLIVALLLGLVGVPASVIAEDYGLTAQYISPRLEELRAKVLAEGRDLKRFERLLSSHETTMLDTLEYLEKNYGSIPDYLSKIGLTDTQIEQLRNTLVE